MTRAAVLGAAFSEAVEVLGLEPVGEGAEVVLVDLRDEDAVAAASRIDASVPRVALGAPEHAALAAALGSAVVVLASAQPAVVGPLVAALRARTPRGPARVIAITGPRGGAGRTLLACGLATRLARRHAVLLLDATGSGAAAWRLGLAAPPWSDLESLVDELSAEHLALVAAERDRLRVVGGAGCAPSVALLRATIEAARTAAECVLVDAPPPHDERGRLLVEAADRVLLVVGDDPLSLAAVPAEIEETRMWIVASRSRSSRIGAHEPLRSLPDDPAAVRAAERGPSAVGGALGRAYDDLADLIATDLS